MRRIIWSAVGAGGAAGIGMIALVIATGQTFGQRCERAYPIDAGAQHACVRRLANGGHQ